MTQTDPITTSEYLELLRDWEKLTPHGVGDALVELDQMYDAYVWYLIAATMGDHEADDAKTMLETAELVVEEDHFLANLQASIWFLRGIHVPKNAEHARARLEAASVAFLDRDLPLLKALVAFGFPAHDGAPVDEKVIEALADRILEKVGWPKSIDFTLPLGPSMPHRPYWLHERHRI
ncbi:hypothetical protein BH09MYX1_BH09MYX1_67990 [soil metagenome]